MQRYDATTALIVVDLQNDFVDPRGSLAVDGAPHIVSFVNDQVRAAREAGAVVAYSQDWHPEHTPHFAQDGGIWPVHCVQDTWGAALHEALTVEGPVVRKGVNGEDGYSAFTMREPVSGATMPTELEGLLRDRAVRSVVVCGVATDYCVKSTTLDAVRLGFATSVLADGIRSVDRQPGDGDVAIAEMEEAGATLVHEWDDGRVHHEQEL
jgi:nicotinamidase/pyrazinamidase